MWLAPPALVGTFWWTRSEDHFRSRDSRRERGSFGSSSLNAIIAELDIA